MCRETEIHYYHQNDYLLWNKIGSYSDYLVKYGSLNVIFRNRPVWIVFISLMFSNTNKSNNQILIVNWNQLSSWQDSMIFTVLFKFDNESFILNSNVVSSRAVEFHLLHKFTRDVKLPTINCKIQGLFTKKTLVNDLKHHWLKLNCET